MGNHTISYQSLLLSTTILNDTAHAILLTSGFSIFALISLASAKNAYMKKEKRLRFSESTHMSKDSIRV